MPTTSPVPGAAWKMGGTWGTQPAILSADTEHLLMPAWPYTGAQHTQTVSSVLEWDRQWAWQTIHRCVFHQKVKGEYRQEGL